MKGRIVLNDYTNSYVSRMVDVPVKKRILIVDDERDVSDSIKIVLSNYGFDVDSDGIEVLKTSNQISITW